MAVKQQARSWDINKNRLYETRALIGETPVSMPQVCMAVASKNATRASAWLSAIMTMFTRPGQAVIWRASKNVRQRPSNVGYHLEMSRESLYGRWPAVSRSIIAGDERFPVAGISRYVSDRMRRSSTSSMFTACSLLS